MPIKSNSNLKSRTSTQRIVDTLNSRTDNTTSVLHDYVDSFLNKKPGENTLPTSDPGVAGEIFLTGSAGMDMGAITGSGFSVLCVSQG